jgi:hypothetical protein
MRLIADLELATVVLNFRGNGFLILGCGTQTPVTALENGLYLGDRARIANYSLLAIESRQSRHRLWTY